MATIRPYDESTEAYRLGKPRKRIVARRAVDHGFLKGAKEAKEAKKPVTKGHDEMLERNLAMVVAVDPSVSEPVGDTYQAKVVEGAVMGLDPVDRARYAALETRKELAAEVLGRGGTFEEAGDAAGVRGETVKRYLEDRAFRDRVEELRSIVRMKVGGRIEAWMDRYTADPDTLDEKDPKTILAIHDRVTGPVGRAAPAHVEQTNVTFNYPDLMGRLAGITRQPPIEAALDVDDAGAQGVSFPTVGPDRS